MRIVVAALLTIHGLVHVLGFVHALGFAKVSGFSGATLFTLPAPVAWVVDRAWLAVCLLLVGSAVLLLAGGDSWWLVAGLGIVLSQLLIIHAWPDARMGTIVNVALLLPVAVGWAEAGFERDTDARMRALLDAPVPRSRIVTEESIRRLPPPVRHWLTSSGVVGRPVPASVRLHQRGSIRMRPGAGPTPVHAEQVFRIDEPGFVWGVRMRMLGVLPVVGRDSYVDGHGRMRIELGALVPVVDAADAKIDQGTLLRFLAETVWFPAAATEPYVAWTPRDDRSATATMTYAGVSGSATFTFDRAGRFTGLTARRYYGGGDDARLERWVVEAREWAPLEGVVVPVRGEVRWELEDGPFTFFEWEVTDLTRHPAPDGSPPEVAPATAVP